MLTVKTRKGKHGEIRRASFKQPATFAEFTTKFVEVFSPLPADYKLKYEDDEGELIVLASQSDYEEALRIVSTSEPQILRVSIFSPKIEQPENIQNSNNHAHQHHGGRCRGGAGLAGLSGLSGLFGMAQSALPDLLNNPALRSVAEGALQSNMLKIVQPYICDACNANIAGDRFNSTTNPNFDLCKSCMESAKGQELEKEHKFKRVSALEALIGTLRNGGTFDAFFAPGSAAEPEPVVRHHAFCDVCNQNIVGIRHKCLDCADYDECNVCRSKSAHVEGHVFHAIEDAAVRMVPEEVRASHEATLRSRAAEAEAVRARAAEEAAAKARVEAENKAREAALLTKLVPPPAPVKVVVEEKKPEPVVAPVADEPSAFERNLQTLESMGFMDRKRNIQVLVRNRNKLFESIQELLA